MQDKTSVRIPHPAFVWLAIMGGLIVTVVLQGYVLKTMWNWFVVSIFSVPNLTVVSAIGLIMVVTFLTHQYPNSIERKRISKEAKEETAKEMVEKGVLKVIASRYYDQMLNLLATFISAWILHYWFM